MTPTESPVADITLVEDGHYVVARGDGSYSEIQATDVKRDDPPSDGRMIVRGSAGIGRTRRYRGADR
jgi:hypothetical protein